ncbi:MAG: DUF2062 domain-containing protein [Acidobacteria bacterium]|nr:DUF2062 domain-containing protein [Acidobacteriota bacterium]
MFRRAFRNLLNLDDPPERTALAFAIGVFIGFSPLLGFHTILVAIIAIMCRFNKLAIITGSLLSNPWTIAPIVAASWAIGRWFIGAPSIELPHFSISAMLTVQFWQVIAAQWRQLIPFAVGATIFSVASGVISYPLMLYFLRACRRRYPRNNNVMVSEREIFGTESK